MTHELQFKSTGENRLQYVAGLYYLHENKSIRYDMEMLANKSFFEDPDLPLGFNPDGLPDSWVFDQAKRTTTSKAAFAQLDYRIVPKVNLTLGYRYSDDEKTDHNGMTYAFWEGSAEWYNGEHTPTGVRAHQSNDLTNNMGSGAPLGTVMPASEPNNVKKSWSQGTYRIGAQYFANDDHMLFASLATGHKMGGMYEMADACNNGCPILLAYDPEEVKTYELGWKGTMLEGRVRLSATAFFSDYTDMQNTGDKVIGTDTDPDSPNFGEPVTAWTTDNLASSRDQGPRARVRHDSVDRRPAVRLSRMARHCRSRIRAASRTATPAPSASSTASRSAAIRRYPTFAAISCRSRPSTRRH